MTRNEPVSPELNVGNSQHPENPHYYIGAAKPQSDSEEHVFAATVFFMPKCSMEDVRAFAVVNAMKDVTTELHYLPGKLLENEDAADTIRRLGFRLWFTTELDEEAIRSELERTGFLSELSLSELASTDECDYWPNAAEMAVEAVMEREPIVPAIDHSASASTGVQLIGVPAKKLDHLMEIANELATAVQIGDDIGAADLESLKKTIKTIQRLTIDLNDTLSSLHRTDEVKIASNPVKPKKIVLTEEEGFEQD